MTGDASRSCLGLAPSIGPTALQIVDTRVLLTAAAPPALPSSSVSAGSGQGVKGYGAAAAVDAAPARTLDDHA
jgi:hypothetical protein